VLKVSVMNRSLLDSKYNEYLFTIAALAKIVFKINVMSVSASYGSFEHHVRNVRNHSGENLIFKM